MLSSSHKNSFIPFYLFALHYYASTFKGFNAACSFNFYLIYFWHCYIPLPIMIVLKEPLNDVLFLSKSSKDHGFPPLRALTRTNLEIESSWVEGEVAVEVQAALFFGF